MVIKRNAGYEIEIGIVRLQNEGVEEVDIELHRVRTGDVVVGRAECSAIRGLGQL